ncbi:MAG TPA: protein kinase [Kofleriaceae bacterium]|nr:protein kinase [Kofleriaceae bacterium]
MTCPDDDTIVDLLEGRLDGAARLALIQHLDGCDACRHLVADAGAFGAPEDDQDDEALLGRGSSIGRYHVQRVLGIGAMGVVYAAHDPQLGRDVAVKLLRREAIGDRSAAEARDVMLREAQTLARLSHPNVIAVHDADVHDDHLFIVMELVEGRTLREWLAGDARSWPAIRDVFVQAGRGLEAAHAAGLVHRDVKPDNILVGRDGRVRVTDFGLARWQGAGPRPSPAAIARAAQRSSTSLVGTPAYMSPEQLAGAKVDARSDLFSFSVALYEAIYGARPFDGRMFEGPADVPVSLPKVSAPAKRGVPARARRVLERGLASDRDLRPANMTELLRELDHRAAITPARALAGVAVVGAAAAAALLLGSRASAPTCDGGPAAWGSVWDDAQRARVKAAFVATKQPIAADAFAQADAAMKDLRARWIGLHTSACRAAARGDISDAVLERRMACLDERLTEAKIVSGGLERDASQYDWIVANAPGAVRGMQPLDDCATARGDDVASTRPDLRPMRAPAALLDPDGHLQVFAIGARGRPWRIAQGKDGAWGAWTPLADPIAVRALVPTRERDGRVGVAAIDESGAIVGAEQRAHGWDDASWGRFGAGDNAQLAIASDGTGRQQVFAVQRHEGRAQLAHVAQAAPNSGWGEWGTWIDDNVEQVVAINDEGPVGGKVHVFALDDHRVMHMVQTASDWTSWMTLADDAHAWKQIDAAVDVNGRLELVALDEQGRAFHDSMKDASLESTDLTSWTGWSPLGTPDAMRSIRVVRNKGDSHLEAFGVTTTGHVIHLWQAGAPLAWNGWWEEIPLAAGMKSVDELALVLDADGKLYIFATAVGGSIWMVWQAAPASGPFHGWLVL